MPPGPIECLILGLPGSGKTLFALTLAAMLGNSSLCVFWEDPGGRIGSRSVFADQARAEALAGQRSAHGLQWTTVTVPMGFGRGRRELLLIDPAGLAPGVPGDERSRSEAAKTLSLLRRVRFLVHLVDASSREGPAELDRAVLRFASTHLPGRFLVLASKIDLPESRQGLRRIRRAWPNVKVLPFSSLNRRGLAAVGRELRRCLDGYAHDRPSVRRRVL